MLAKSTGFTVVAALTLTLGIVANTAIFSYINAFIIKPLPYPQSERLMIFESHDTKKGWTREGLTSTASFAASSVPFGGFGASVVVEAAEKPVSQPRERFGARFTAVSSDYFSAMQIGLVKGRVFTSADAQGSSPSAIINETLARQLWPNEDPIGHQLRFGEQRTVCTIR